MNFRDLQDKKKVQRIIEEKFNFVDFENKMMKHCKEKINHMPQSKKAFVEQVLKRQQKIATAFLRHKDNIHKEEDPQFLDSLSDIFDIRNWNLSAFDPESDMNKDDESFQAELQEMLKKFTLCKDFCCDLDLIMLENEMAQTLRLIYASESNSKNLAEAKQRMHLIDQWIYLRGTVPQFGEHFQPLFLRIVKRAAAAPNALTG